MAEPRYVQGDGPTNEEKHRQCVLPPEPGVREGAYTRCPICGDYFGYLDDEGYIVWRRLSPIWNPFHYYRAVQVLSGED